MRRAGSALFVIALAACGGGMMEPSVSEKAAAPATLEEAEAQLQAARAELERPGSMTAPPPVATATATEQPIPQPPRVIEDDCARVCRAFASMQRAQEAICRLVGEQDPRCADAKKTVNESASRVARCGCAT